MVSQLLWLDYLIDFGSNIQGVGAMILSIITG
jgi:hypothetical protein